MDTVNGLAVAQDVQRRIEALNRLIAETPRPPDPRPQGSDVSLRRTVSRLRAGRIRPVDPAVDPATLADALEKELAYRVLLMTVLTELDVIRDILSSAIETMSGELLEQLLPVFHDLKHLPAAGDPDSDVSERIRRMHRARRADSGRPRRK